jgi:hypothetical protein
MYIKHPFTVTQVLRQSVTINATGMSGSSMKYFVAQVIQNQTVLASTTIASGGSYTLSFTPSSTSLPLSLSITSGSAAIGTLSISSLTYWHWENVPISVTELVCNGGKDRYRFGFNDKEKDNEIAGAGNRNTAKFWEGYVLKKRNPIV